MGCGASPLWTRCHLGGVGATRGCGSGRAFCIISCQPTRRHIAQTPRQCAPIVAPHTFIVSSRPTRRHYSYKITGVAKPPLPRPARPSPFFTVLFLEANWGWPLAEPTPTCSKFFLFLLAPWFGQLRQGACASSISQAPVPRKSTATLRKSTAHRHSFSRPFRV